MSESLHIQVGDKHIIDLSQVQMVEKCDVSNGIENDVKGVPLTPSLRITWKRDANHIGTFKQEGASYIGFKNEEDRDGYFWSVQRLLHASFAKRFIP